MGVTEEALYQAKKHGKVIYNFNLFEEEFDSPACHVLGPAVETLPLLYNMMLQVAGRPRMYFYPIQHSQSTNDISDDAIATNIRYGIPPKIIDGIMDQERRRSALTSNLNMNLSNYLL